MSKQHSSSKPTAGKPAAFAWAKLDRTPVPYNEDADVDVILSYATATCGGNGLVAVECIARELMNAGIRPFHGRMVPAGMNWQEAWYGELDDAKGAIMLLSEDYFKSGPCVEELIAILKRMPKNIIPVCLGPVQMGKGFLGSSKQERKQASFIRNKLDGNCLPPPDLGVFQDNWADNVQDLIRRVKAMLRTRTAISTANNFPDPNQVPSADAAIAKFRAAFGENMDNFINSNGDLYLRGKVDTAAKQEAVCQIIASNATCSKWTSGKLYLDNNQLGDGAGKEIGKALATNSTLKGLDLGRNQLGDGAGKEIGKALATNSTLKELNLWDNQISRSTKESIKSTARSGLSVSC